MSIPTIEELEAALATALENKRSLRVLPPPVSTYWVRARVSTRLGTLEAKVAFGQGTRPECTFVTPELPGWNFSSREHAEEMAEYAAGHLQSVIGSNTIVTEVVEES